MHCCSLLVEGAAVSNEQLLRSKFSKGEEVFGFVKEVSSPLPSDPHPLPPCIVCLTLLACSSAGQSERYLCSPLSQDTRLCSADDDTHRSGGSA